MRRIVWCLGGIALISLITGTLAPCFPMASGHGEGRTVARHIHPTSPKPSLTERGGISENGELCFKSLGELPQAEVDNSIQLVVASDQRSSGDGEWQRPKARSGGQFTALSTEAMNVFAAEMYGKIGRKSDNVTFSPFSVFSTLVIAVQGAKGATRREIEAVLHVNNAGVPVYSTIGKLVPHLKRSTASDGGLLAVANGIWVLRLKDYRLRKKFLKTVREHHDVTVRAVKPPWSPRIVAGEINDWTNKVTEGRIARLVTQRDLMNKQTWVMSLLNAVYYKNAWHEPFHPLRTKDEAFTLLDGSKIQVRMMNGDASTYSYTEDATFQAVEIPYRGGNAAMVVFLPWKADGLAEMERWLTAENLRSSLRKLSYRSERLKVSMPRFSIRSRLKMIRTLQSMGIRKGFIPAKADFTGLFERSTPDVQELRPFMSLVMQEACIDVTEEGTVAAAATRADFDFAMPRPANSFRADHPFMFIIYHKPTNCILFMGRVTRPQS